MSRPVTLQADRLLPAEPQVRGIARTIYASVAGAPLLSPHGHVDAQLLVDDEPFADAASLFITPDHYVTRLLHAHGVALEDLGVPSSDGGPAAGPREVWRRFCSHWWAFRGTPSRYWLECELTDVFDLHVAPSAESADMLFDAIGERLQQPEFRPRALFERFRLEVLATTDDPASDLAAHEKLASDPSFHGHVLPTFRPDAYLDAATPGWAQRLRVLAEVSDCDTATYDGFLEALRRRRAYFAQHGATATDHGPADARSEPLSAAESSRIHAAALAGLATSAETTAYAASLLFDMAAMSAEDGLVMQLHPGVLRGHHEPTARSFGPDTGHDLPLRTEFVHGLRPILQRFGTSSTFRMVLFTVDETAFSRDIAPLAGFYPAVYAGAPWWFLDTPDAIGRYRNAVTDTAGFYKTAGFVDDTRAFCSIPARHDMSRRVDAGHLARLVAEHRLDLDEAVETAQDLVRRIPRDVFRLPGSGA